MWIISLIVLVINECAAGEGWHRGVIKSFAALCILTAAAGLFPGQSLALLLMGFSAFVARELCILDARKTAAGERLKQLQRPAFSVNTKSLPADGDITAETRAA